MCLVLNLWVGGLAGIIQLLCLWLSLTRLPLRSAISLQPDRSQSSWPRLHVRWFGWPLLAEVQEGPWRLCVSWHPAHQFSLPRIHACFQPYSKSVPSRLVQRDLFTWQMNCSQSNQEANPKVQRFSALSYVIFAQVPESSSSPDWPWCKGWRNRLHLW